MQHEMNIENKPRKVDKPWGYELIFAHTDKYAGKLLSIKKGHRLSLQYHEKKDESLYVYEGAILLLLTPLNGATTSKTLRSGDCQRITPLVRHRMEAIEDALLFEVSTPELDDVVRLEDDYGRTGRAEEGNLRPRR